MKSARNYVLTIAGFDPSAGAGLLADIKTFEQHKVYGLSVCTAITLQTENVFFSIKWETINEVLQAVDVIQKNYFIPVVKIGIVPSFDFLLELVTRLKNNFSDVKIIVDPILKSSTGFDFKTNHSKEKLKTVLKNIFLITPNIQEILFLTDAKNPTDGAKEISQYCNVFLKGGHSESALGVDYLYCNGNVLELKPMSKKYFSKHGSGCVLSAAITANLALGFDLKTACINAKKYTEHFLNSNESLLGYHHV